MRRVTLLVALAVILAACGGGGGDADDDAPADRQPPVTVSGSGIENSDPFTLAEGDYRVEWTATPDHDTGCYHGAQLDSTDESEFVFEQLANELLDTIEPASGSTNVYGLDGGRYYVSASSGCDWSFTFTQQ